MTALRRIKTLETHEQKLRGPVPNTFVTVDKFIFEKGESGHVKTYVPKYAVYKDKEGKELTKTPKGFVYKDGSPLKVTGEPIVIREGLMA